MNEAARLFAWEQLRGSWSRRLGLALLLAAVGAVAIGSAAGAIRTSSAVGRFLTDQRAFDLLVFCGSPDVDGDDFVCERDIAGVEGIEDTAPLLELMGAPSVAGRSIEPADADACFDGPGDVKLVVSPDGRYGSSINELRFIAGRPVDPSRPEEIVISRDLSERVGLGVGDSIDFQLFDGAACNGDRADWGSQVSLTVVGIEVSPFEVRPDSGEYRSLVHAGPSLLDSVGDLPDTELMVAARTRPGVEVADLLEPFEELGISMDLVDVDGRRFAVPQAINSENLQRSLRAHVAALWLLSALTAVAGLALVGQMLNRQIRGSASEFVVLGHLGLTRRDLYTVGSAHLLSVVLPATLLAAAGAYLTSSLTPLGLARIVEVSPGLRAEPVVLALGTAVMILGLAAIAVPSLIAVARGREPRSPLPTGRAAAVARRVGVGPVTTTGVRMAFEPVRGPAAPPQRTGFAVILAAVVLLVCATVFAGSIAQLRGSKHLVGWNWDAMLFTEGRPVSDARLQAVLSETEGVVSATPGTIFTPVLVRFGTDRTLVAPLSIDGPEIVPTMISGRAPSGPSEIVMGRETLARLGYEEGDRIPFVAYAGEPGDSSGADRRGELEIVGTAVLPSIGGNNRLGTGAAVDLEFVRSVAPDAVAGAVFVRLEPGVGIIEVTAAAADALGTPVGSITEETFALDQSLRDIERSRLLPIVFAALLVLLSGAIVAQVVVGSTRARREELAVLRALGLRPGDIRGAIVVQALAVVGSALLVGVPLGVALGRVVWQRFALSVGTKPEVDLAGAWLAVLVIGLLAAATLFGVAASARPRRELAAALRRE